ncbi:hypothetical protein HFP89_02725 [Wenzhouxiangella sp. XN79A]|uniref:hypothetical protein n=1 Tax=Wenzhouxiangella sp. XN79A TaxID=2724193 RepID=UPI00144A70A8|nr:hypothetical protein [Wenzhouxiangella sp. XN79A]NKI34079.1 hypothetical protein [Wenzhouxiangella sp. XN79A]
MDKGLKHLGFGLLLAAWMAPASADVLLIEEVRERMQRDLPENGLTTAEVEDRYGAPIDRGRPVGDPPITRWTYDDYSVYFEFDVVIDSVLHHGAVLGGRTGRGG